MTNPDDEIYARYAIYFVPRQGTALARFGKDWFGYDIEAGIKVDAAAMKLERAQYENAITVPQRYGFHATFKAPFSLRPQCDVDDLFAATEDLAQSTAPVAIGGLQIDTISDFLVLLPTRESKDLNKLALRCVRLLDAYRAPGSAAELAKRRAAGLDAREERMLLKWGYPYVKKSYRFHMTLTDRLKPRELKLVEPSIAEIATDVIDEPMMIEDICVLGDPGNGAPFRLLERFALSGRP